MRILLYCGVFSFAVPTLLVCIMVYRYMRLRFSLRGFPGPSPSFYFGNADKYLMDEKGERIPFLYMQKNLQKQYAAQGDLVKFSVGSVPMVEIYGVARFHVFNSAHFPNLLIRALGLLRQCHIVRNTFATASFRTLATPNRHRQVSHSIAFQGQPLFVLANACAPWLRKVLCTVSALVLTGQEYAHSSVGTEGIKPALTLGTASPQDLHQNHANHKSMSLCPWRTPCCTPGQIPLASGNRLTCFTIHDHNTLSSLPTIPTTGISNSFARNLTHPGLRVCV